MSAVAGRGRWHRRAEVRSPIGIRDLAACPAKTFPHRHATSRIPAPRIPGSVHAAPAQDRNVRRCRGLRVPNFGENPKEFVLRFAKLSEDRCLQRRPATTAILSIELPETPASSPGARPRTWSRSACSNRPGATQRWGRRNKRYPGAHRTVGHHRHRTNDSRGFVRSSRRMQMTKLCVPKRNRI